MQAKDKYAMIRVRWSDYVSAKRIQDVDGRTLTKIAGAALRNFENIPATVRFGLYDGKKISKKL